MVAADRERYRRGQRQVMYHFCLRFEGTFEHVVYGFNYAHDDAKQFLELLHSGASVDLQTDASIRGLGAREVRRAEIADLCIARTDKKVALALTDRDRERAFALATPVSERDVLEPEEAKTVFIVHGRNEAVLTRLIAFIDGLGLRIITWEDARAMTNEATPYVLEVVDAGMANAQAVLVIMTAEDRAGLLPQLAKSEDDRADTQLQGQPRENVLFEAGMAIARGRKRTILVFVGDVRFPSDLAGRHVVRLDNSARTRRDLLQRLQTAGCLVKPRDDWLSRGALQEDDVMSVTRDAGA